MSVASMLQKSLDELTQVRKDLGECVREIDWAVQDLKSGAAALPQAPPAGCNMDVAYLEFATRSIVPVKLPKILERVRAALEELNQLNLVVEPLPKEVTGGQAQAPV